MIRAYLETTVLCGSSWPPWAGRIDYAAELVKKLGGVLITPDPVEREAEQHNLRAISADVSGIPDKLKRLPPSAQAALRSPSLFNLEVVRKEYRELWDEWKQRLSIESCPLTSKSLDQLFSMAVAHEIPFGDEGRGFQDVVIYHSIREDLARYPGAVGLLIAKDERYRSPALRAQEQIEGIRLRADTLDDAIKFLEGQSNEEERRAREHEKGSARAALLGVVPEVEQFVRENLVLTAEQLGLVGHVVAIEDLRVTDVENVTISHSGKTEPGCENIVEIAFNAQLSLRFVFLTPPKRLSPSGIRAVDDPRVAWSEALTPTYGDRERLTLTFAPTVEALGSATADPDGYRNFHFHSVRLRPPKEWMRLRDALNIANEGEWSGSSGDVGDRLLHRPDIKRPDPR